MQFPRPGRLLLWAVLFVFLAPIVVGIPASLWLSWRLDPVQSFYFGPYLVSALEGGTKGVSSTVHYAEKTAPGRKSEMLLPGDAVAGKGTQRLALSPKALAEGWHGIAAARSNEQKSVCLLTDGDVVASAAIFTHFD